MKKVLWLSRHQMDEIQERDLERIYGEGEIEIIQVNKTIESVEEIPDLTSYDIFAVVLPLLLVAELIKKVDGKPVIMAQNKRVLTSDGKVVFSHAGWIQYEKIEIIAKKL